MLMTFYRLFTARFYRYFSHASQVCMTIVRIYLKELSENIKNSGGLMTPEYVADGFYKLVTKCDNGTVIWAFNDLPFLIIPDDANKKIIKMDK